jgi:hypothetical protein
MALSKAQRDLKRATQREVMKCGGVVAVERATTMTRADISKYQSESDEWQTRFIPLDHALELGAASGEFIVVRELAALAGFDTVPADPRRAAEECVPRVLGRLAKSAGDLQHTVSEAMADGKLSPNEDRAVDEKMADVKDNLESLEEAKARLRA